MKKMKNFRIFVMMLFVSLCFANKLNAQITLEHTFEGNVVGVTQLGGYYYSIDRNDDCSIIITTYKPDYSLNKTTILQSPIEEVDIEQISAGTVIFYTPELFVVSWQNYDFSDNITMLYDAYGNILKEWNDYVIGTNVLNNNKFWVRSYSESGKEIFEVYSIDGYESVENVGVKSLSHAYPNHARNTISLPYNLNKGEQAEMLIYDVNGKMIEKKTIDSHFNKIMLNVETYTPGIYFYSVNGVSQKFVVR